MRRTSTLQNPMPDIALHVFAILTVCVPRCELSYVALFISSASSIIQRARAVRRRVGHIFSAECAWRQVLIVAHARHPHISMLYQLMTKPITKHGLLNTSFAHHFQSLSYWLQQVLGMLALPINRTWRTRDDKIPALPERSNPLNETARFASQLLVSRKNVFPLFRSHSDEGGG